MRMSSRAALPPSVPKPSASLILLNPRNELLLLHRPTHSRAFPNAHVFPGGVVSTQDTHTTPNTPLETLKLCALRETFEETGILLTTTPHTLPPSTVSTARKSIHANTQTFTSFLHAHSLTPDVDALHTFTRWITPPTLARRYSSQIFIAFPEEVHVASDDGGVEVDSVKLMTPTAALGAAASKEIVFFPPQLYLISRIAEALRVGGREEVLRMAGGGFSAMIVEPQLLRVLPDKRLVLGLGERGDKEWAVVVRAEGSGEPRGAELVRRVDVAKL